MSDALNDFGWVVFAASAAAAASAALVAGLMGQLVAELPAEDRQYLDAPPIGFRFAWLPVQLVATCLGSYLPEGLRRRLSHRLQLAGLDYCLTAEQFLAFTTLCASAALLLAWFISSTWGLNPLPGSLLALMIGSIIPMMWLRDRIEKRSRGVQKALPYALDLITLCVEAGLTLQSALGHAVAKGPPGPLRDEMARVLRDRRAGKTRIEALRNMSERMRDPAIGSLVSALIQSETLGMNLGPILRAQAEQRRMERFSRAEKLAMEAPVKMLFPLIAFIFPCTFIVLGFPIAIKFLRMGL